MFKAKIAEARTTDWTSLTVFAPKKNGCFRPSVDYRRGNVFVERNSYQISRMDERIDSLGNVAVFLILDANHGY